MKYLILVIGLVYLGIGIDQYLKGDKWQLLIYAGYAAANVGLYYKAL